MLDYSVPQSTDGKTTGEKMKKKKTIWSDLKNIKVRRVYTVNWYSMSLNAIESGLKISQEKKVGVGNSLRLNPPPKKQKQKTEDTCTHVHRYRINTLSAIEYNMVSKCNRNGAYVL